VLEVGKAGPLDRASLVRRLNVFETLATAAWRELHVVNIAVAYYGAVCCFSSKTLQASIGWG
jgi:hypothetical protein